MVEPMAVSIASTVASKLLEQVMEATKIAISCNKCCKVLHALLKELQPIVDYAVRQISQSNFDNAFKRPRSAVHDWEDELEGTLKRAAVEVNKCIKQQPDLNPVARYNTGKRILDVTESVQKLLQQAGSVGLAVTFSESSRAQRMEKMMQEIHEMMYDLRATALRIEFTTVTQESLQENYTTSSAQGITSAIKSALHNFLQNLCLGPSDNMSRVDTGASSSSSCPRELIVNEDAHKLTDIRQVPQHVFGLDKFTMRLQRSITSSSIDAEPRCVGVSGMGGLGKTLLAQIAYNSREVREHFKGGKLIWLTVSQTPNIKGLYDSFCRQLGLMPMSFTQLEEYRTGLYNEFLRRRVFLVLDDVWNKRVLEQLDLAKGRGSVTLVTTRNPVLTKDKVQVGVLSKEDSWNLFCVHAFPRGFSNIPLQLQGVAELIAEECKGLPLALKVIGRSMVGKTTRQEWEFQLKCLQESCQLPEQQEEEALFGSLKLSYDYLDTVSPICKKCFLGFAAFPEDHMVRMEELIQLWKAQGLLDDPTKLFGDDPTLFAYYLVGLLIGCSLIEPARIENDWFACKVHDVMRDLALHIIEGEKPITCLYRPGKKLVEFPGDWIRTYERQPCEVRNLSLMRNDLTTLNGVTFSAPKLEVLLLSQNWWLEAMPKQFLKGIENLKVLDLSHCFMLKSLPRAIGNLRQLTHLYLVGCQQLESLPREIGNLRQLTHLDLAWILELKSLPKEIGKLTQLTYLDLQGTNLQSLPKEVGQLTQLIHLDLSDCEKLKKLPKSMGDLRSLQYLSLVGASSDRLWGKSSSELYGQADICELTTLTALHISGKTCKTLELSKLVKLKSFHIHDFHKLETLPDAIHSMVHLEEFWVFKCEQLKILPSFITLFSKLNVLRLDGMSSLDSLPALNTLKLLSTLCITMCKSIKKLPDSFTSSDAFPSLKELNCYGSGLVEFLEVEDGAMPKLQILNLDGTNIKSLPDTLIYLKNLKVVYICEDRFDDLCQKFENTWLSRKFERQPCELHKLSLMENDLTTLNGVTFSAPKLDVLLHAQNEKLEAMPKQFLKGIENLKLLEPGTSQGNSRDNEIRQFSQHGEDLLTYLDQVGHFVITENGNFEEENLQKSLQHMLIGLQRHGEAAATNLHQFHAECMGDSIFVAAREVVQGVEFLFSDAQCMSRVVGVGLERAKVLVTRGYEVGVMQLCEIDWKISWEKVFSQVKDSESSELVAIKMPKLQGDHVKSTSLPAEDISRKFGVSLKDFPETHVITLNCEEEQSAQFFPLVWKVVDEYRNLKCGSTCATTKQTSGTGSTKSPNTSSSGSIQQSTSGGGPNFSQSPSLTRQEEKMDDDEDDDKSLPPEDPLPPDPSSAPNDMRNRKLKVSIFPGAGGAFHDPDTKQPVQQTPFRQVATIMPVIEIEFLQEGIDKKFITVTTKTQCNLGTDGGPKLHGVKLFSWYQNNIKISFKSNDQQTQLLSSASAPDDSLNETKLTINKALMASTSLCQEESHGAGGQIRIAGSGVQGQIDIKATETQGRNLTIANTQEIGGIKQIQGFIVHPRCRENDLVFNFCLPSRLMPGSSTQSGIDLQSLSQCDDTFEPKVTGKWIVWSEEQHAYYVFKVRRYLYRLPSSKLNQDKIKCLMQDYKLLMFVNLAMRTWIDTTQMIMLDLLSEIQSCHM